MFLTCICSLAFLRHRNIGSAFLKRLESRWSLAYYSSLTGYGEKNQADVIADCIIFLAALQCIYEDVNCLKLQRVDRLLPELSEFVLLFVKPLLLCYS